MGKSKLQFENMSPWTGPRTIELVVQARPTIIRGGYAVAHGDTTESDSYVLTASTLKDFQRTLDALTEMLYARAPEPVPPRRLQHGERVEWAFNFRFRQIVLGASFKE